MREIRSRGKVTRHRKRAGKESRFSRGKRRTDWGEKKNLSGGEKWWGNKKKTSSRIVGRHLGRIPNYKEKKKIQTTFPRATFGLEKRRTMTLPNQKLDGGGSPVS